MGSNYREAWAKLCEVMNLLKGVGLQSFLKILMELLLKCIEPMIMNHLKVKKSYL